jgi:hypothetical protein
MKNHYLGRVQLICTGNDNSLDGYGENEVLSHGDQNVHEKNVIKQYIDTSKT